MSFPPGHPFGFGGFPPHPSQGHHTFGARHSISGAPQGAPSTPLNAEFEKMAKTCVGPDGEELITRQHLHQIQVTLATTKKPGNGGDLSIPFYEPGIIVLMSRSVEGKLSTFIKLNKSLSGHALASTEVTRQSKIISYAYFMEEERLVCWKEFSPPIYRERTQKELDRELDILSRTVDQNKEGLEGILFMSLCFNGKYPPKPKKDEKYIEYKYHVFITELADTTVGDLLSRKERGDITLALDYPSPRRIFKMFLQGLTGLNYLAMNGRVHGDLNPGNLLLFKLPDGTYEVLRITDFDAAMPIEVLRGIAEDLFMAPLITPPEVTSTRARIKAESLQVPRDIEQIREINAVLGPAVDVYALAVNMWGLYRKEIVNLQLGTPDNPEGDKLVELFTRMVADDPRNRPTAVQAFQAAQNFYDGWVLSNDPLPPDATTAAARRALPAPSSDPSPSSSAGKGKGKGKGKGGNSSTHVAEAPGPKNLFPGGLLPEHFYGRGVGVFNWGIGGGFNPFQPPHGGHHPHGGHPSSRAPRGVTKGSGRKK